MADFVSQSVTPHMRQLLTRHAVLLHELWQSIQKSENKDVMVHVAASTPFDSESASYKLMHTLLQQHGVPTVHHETCHILYHMPHDGGAGHPTTMYLAGHTNYYVVHPASVTYGLEHKPPDAWYKIMLLPVCDDDPVYTLSVMRDPLFLVHTQFVRNFGHRLKYSGNHVMLA